MIYLTCKKIPDGTTAVGLYEKVKPAFPKNAGNQEYIDELYRRSRDVNAKESLYALSLLAHLLDVAGSMPLDMGATLCRDKNGKPHIDGCNWHFNVSHSHSYVAVALSDRGDVGVDIENTAIEAQKAIKMAQRFFTEDEQACVESQPASFHDVWSAKEAIAKYYGMPLGELIDISKHKPTLYLELLKRIKTQKFDINGCAVTLCVSAAENDIRLIN